VTELAEIAASDRALRRFGASRHRYEMEPPIALEADVPEDYRRFVQTIGAGGAGPYYGLVSASRAVAHPIDGPWGRGIPIGHLGCGYAAILSLAGPVWIAARAIGCVREIRPSFTAYYVTWLAQLAANELPESFVPPGVCPLPTALGGYLGVCEQELGLAAGTIAGTELTESLGRLGRGAIEIAAEAAQPLFSDGDRVDPCIACACLVDNLGLSRDVIAPGIAPRV
jgi:hypothetical protein